MATTRLKPINTNITFTRLLFESLTNVKKECIFYLGEITINRDTSIFINNLNYWKSNYAFRAAREVAIVANATTLTELSGMRIAEIRGVSMPEAAKEIPTILYRNEMVKPA
jgi:hypothetical protein